MSYDNPTIITSPEDIENINPAQFMLGVIIYSITVGKLFESRMSKGKIVWYVLD